MIHQLRSVWNGYVMPMLQRPDRLQVAALCYRGSGGDKEVLLITSRGTGRWVLPKGWPITGLDAAGSAMQEAWEEAGVRSGATSDEPVGSFVYEKGLNHGWSVTVEALVFSVEVDELKDDFPEASERRRVWVKPEQAADMVDEPELQALLATF